MARQSTHFMFAVLTASCAFAQPVTPSITAQPVISVTEVVNSASYLPRGCQAPRLHRVLSSPYSVAVWDPTRWPRPVHCRYRRRWAALPSPSRLVRRP